jgi:putative ABC transport system permease protein
MTVIALGVGLTVLLSGYIGGVFEDVIRQNARFDTGHVKVVTRAYQENMNQLPIDLAILDLDVLTEKLETEFEEYQFVPRIKFGGLIDIPNDDGSSRAQGPAIGFSYDLFNPGSGEVERLNLKESIIEGRLPKKSREALLGHAFAKRLGIELGEEVTYFGSTMNGSMTFMAFTVVGTVRFGAAALDKGALIADISDVQNVLDMENGASELLGFLPDKYDQAKVDATVQKFETLFSNEEDEFAPVMMTLRDQNGLDDIMGQSEIMSSIFVFLFVLAMSVVLWNTGLLGGLRRYKEFGIRMALGQSKGEIYRNMVIEAVIIGALGSIIGTLLGLAATYYLQEVGMDIGEMMKDSTMLMPNVVRAKITPDLYFIGFIPGVLAMVIGTMLSGIGIYKRETATLFKELEV